MSNHGINAQYITIYLPLLTSERVCKEAYLLSKWNYLKLEEKAIRAIIAGQFPEPGTYGALIA